MKQGVVHLTVCVLKNLRAFPPIDIDLDLMLGHLLICVGAATIHQRIHERTIAGADALWRLHEFHGGENIRRATVIRSVFDLAHIAPTVEATVLFSSSRC